jgi:hypothetical protein
MSLPHDCEELPETVKQSVCPLCGRNYDSYMSHLLNCPEK